MTVEDKVAAQNVPLKHVEAQHVHVPLKHVEADHARLETLFHTLDHNGDGFIDEHELIGYMTSFYGEDGDLLEEEARVSRLSEI